MDDEPYFDKNTNSKADHLQSQLTTEPTAAAHIRGSGEDNLGGINEEGGESSLFDKGLIDINTGRTINDSQHHLQQQVIRQSTDYEDESSVLNATTTEKRTSLIKKQMISKDISGVATGMPDHQWGPNGGDSQARKGGHPPTYYSTKTSAADGIVGKLGRLEAMIMSQGGNNGGGGQRRKKKNFGPSEKVPYPIKQTTIDRIIYPVYTKKGLKYGKPKKKQFPDHGQLEQLESQEPIGKLLDGFLILYSCRVKLPHEAIKSKLASQKIVEVIEEDLCYFQNLNSIDLSDNKVRIEQLRNLKSLAEVNLQYNNIQTIPSLSIDDFPKLEILNLSYNQLTPASIRHLYQLPRLKNLDLQGNNLVTLPEDLKELKYLEELNLSSNLLSTASTLINPAVLMKVLGQIPKLKRLSLSRNKLQGLHFDILNRDEDFVLLQELDIGYNLVQEEDDVWYATQIKNLQILIITGNPFALAGKNSYLRLEEAMQKNLSATVINEDVPDQKAYLKKAKNQRQLANFPYPNPIKLFSRDMNAKEIKGEYLNAEMMNQGVALQISEIRPDTNIEQEIFPRELTRDAQEKEIFTPPNHKQMRFLKSGGGANSLDNGESNQFFITENILDSNPIGDSRIIHEERSQQESEIEAVQDDQDQLDDEEESEEGDGEQEMDANFDFGKAKMDYFKQRAKDILMNEGDMEYQGSAMQLGMCFKNLKNAIRNPVVVHAGSEQKPHYLKMTFSTCRAAVNGDRFLEMSKIINSSGTLKADSGILGENSTSSFLPASKSHQIPALMRAGKEQYEGNSLSLFQGGASLQKKKSKKEELIDKKIEYLLETYKKQDEELIKKAEGKHSKKRQEQKNLRDKFGFSDDEDDDDGVVDDDDQSDMNTHKKSGMVSTGKFNQSGTLPPVQKSKVSGKAF